jgi:hypothetical protein
VVEVVVKTLLAVMDQAVELEQELVETAVLDKLIQLQALL